MHDYLALDFHYVNYIYVVIRLHGSEVRTQPSVHVFISEY